MCSIPFINTAKAGVQPLAEGLSGRFLRIDRQRYGIIPGVTDKEWYTNSSHRINVA